MQSKELKELLSKETPQPESGCVLSEMYGQRPTIDETPNLIAKKLNNFERKINLLPTNEKRGYIRVKKKCPNLASDEDFKLIYLCSEIFGAKVSLFVRCVAEFIEIEFCLLHLNYE